MRRLIFLGVVAGVLLSGCSGSIRPDAQSVPAPSIARFLPHGYRVVKTYRADLSGGAVSDVIVTSATPVRAGSALGADIQVLSWDRAMRRWRLTFDGRSARWPNTELVPQDSNQGPGYPYRLTYPGKHPLPPQLILGKVVAADAYVDQVAFVPLLGGNRDQLVFVGAYEFGAGVQGILGVVGFHDGTGKVIYSWEGQTGIGPVQISRNRIRAEANYLVPGQPLADPGRTYQFALGARAGRIVEVYDDRPFLGIIMGGAPYGRPVVVHAVSHGPAAGRLRPGDAILAVENAPRMAGFDGSTPFRVGPGWRSTLKYGLTVMLSNFRAGQTARFLIRRGNKRLTVRVKLGSLMSPAASAIKAPKSNDEAL